MRTKLIKIHQYITDHPKLIYWGGVFDAFCMLGIAYFVYRCAR